MTKDEKIRYLAERLADLFVTFIPDNEATQDDACENQDSQK